MPVAPPRICAKCKQPFTGARCPRCSKEDDKRYENKRGTAASRGYGAGWPRLRAAKLKETPLCERCFARGRITPATLVHHKDRNRSNRSWENLESLCNACHEEEHKDERFGKHSNSKHQ